MPLPYALTPANARVVSPLTIWSRTVHFSRKTRWRRLHRKNRPDMASGTPSVIKTSLGNTPGGTHPQAKRDVIFTSEKPATKVPTASEHTSANLVGGTIPRPIAHSLPRVQSPFPIDVWRDALRNHPDSDLVNDLLHDIEHGVRIGFHQDRSPLISPNHFSATSNPTPVAMEIERELLLNRKAGPFLSPPFSHFVGSPMGAIPKKHSQPPKWRIITDLSWPAGQSVNDAIPKELYTCSYDSLDNAIAYLKLFGPNALMSKLDLSDAFRHILVDPRDWELLGSTWPIVTSDGCTQTGYFFDMFLPFGLRSSPALFLKFIDGLRYVMAERGATPLWNYLDDFWTCGPPAPDDSCAQNLDVMLRTCSDMGFAVNPDKTVRPTTSLVLLGVQLDTVTQEMRIDSSRLTEIINLLHTWSTKRRCTKRQLQSLIGKLHFICNVCRPGRTFLRRMIDVLCKANHPTHHLRLNRAFHMDLSWWRIFRPSWNGCSFFFDDEWISSPHLELYTDACDSGFGAYFSGNWLYGSFADHDIPHSRSITFKELYAIAAAVHTWSDSLACRNILFHCDNLSVVHILSSGTSKCRHIMILLRFLFFTCAHHNIMLRAKHINGVDNNWADALSRSQVDKFLASCPMAARHPTPTTPLPLTSFK